jgi:thiamine transporter ThiT
VHSDAVTRTFKHVMRSTVACEEVQEVWHTAVCAAVTHVIADVVVYMCQYAAKHASTAMYPLPVVHSRVKHCIGCV